MYAYFVHIGSQDSVCFALGSRDESEREVQDRPMTNDERSCGGFMAVLEASGASLQLHYVAHGDKRWDSCEKRAIDRLPKA